MAGGPHGSWGKGAIPWWLGLALLAGPAAGVRAGEVETRDYTVFIDGKRGGDAHMTINRQDDGAVTMSCDTDIRFNVLPLVVYKYSYRGRETWKDGRLQLFSSTCNDNGKLYAVTAVAEANGLRVRVNDSERLIRPDVWLTSYWRLPDAKQRDQSIPLLDADTGKDLDGRLQHLAAAQLNVAGQVQTVHHYRLTGKVFVDLWFDAGERLVRQEWVEDGHRTVVDLARVRR